MPACPHCGSTQYATYCRSYVKHVENCRTAIEMFRIPFLNAQEKVEERQRIEFEKEKLQISIGKQLEKSKWRIREADLKAKHAQELLKVSKAPVTNIYIQMNNFYLDYPKSEVTEKVLKDANQNCDVRKIQSIDDLNLIIGYVQDLNDKEIEKCLSGNDTLAKSRALSFLADVSRTIRERMQKETPEKTFLIEAAQEFETECLEDKQALIK